jgi:hypothetical protein
MVCCHQWRGRAGEWAREANQHGQVEGEGRGGGATTTAAVVAGVEPHAPTHSRCVTHDDEGPSWLRMTHLLSLLSSQVVLPQLS